MFECYLKDIYTVLIKSFVTLHICQMFFNLSLANHFKFVIAKIPVIYTNKTTILEKLGKMIVVLLEKQYTKGVSQ